MLAVIRVLPPPKSHFLRYRAAKGKIPLEILNKNILNADFLEIHVTPGKKGINYMVLEGKLCCLSGRTVLSDVITPSDGCRIRQYNAQEYRKRLLFNSVIDVIKHYSADCKITVLLCDREASCTGAAAELTSAGATVIVATDRPCEYEKCRRYCETEYGATPLLFGYDTPVPIFDIAVILSEGLLPPGIGDFGNKIIFSGTLRKDAFCYGTSQNDFPEEIIRYCADDIDPSVMAAALCEEQGVFSLLCITPEYLVKNGSKTNLRGIVRLLEHKKNKKQ